ncbi:MAG: PilN domain-containing protein [Nitrospirota bacterium]|nr:PilN domain-containing protein [Nitrospirota bacterium]
MIKVNLLPVKKKKKAKPIPTFLISTIFLTVIVGLVLMYFVYMFNSRVEARQVQFRENEIKIEELKERIKAVEDYEKRNKIYRNRKKIIEQLGKDKTKPVKILDEVSKDLPGGVWLRSMDVKGNNVILSCTAFTNTDVVNYVNNLKNSRLFTGVYLQESVQAKASKTADDYKLYDFIIKFQVKL